MADPSREDHVELSGRVRQRSLRIADSEVDTGIASAGRPDSAFADVDAAHPEALAGEERSPEAVPTGDVEQTLAPLQPKGLTQYSPGQSEPQASVGLGSRRPTRRASDRETIAPGPDEWRKNRDTCSHDMKDVRFAGIRMDALGVAPTWANTTGLEQSYLRL